MGKGGVELKQAITFFRGVGVVTCALAIVGAVFTMRTALDLHTVPCPASAKFPNAKCDVCGFKANAGSWHDTTSVTIDYWGCRSDAETMRAVVHSIFLIIGALLIIAGESRLAKLLEMFEFVATFKGRAFCYLFMGIYCLGIPGIGMAAMALSFVLAFLQMVIAVKFGTQLEYDAIMSK